MNGKLYTLKKIQSLIIGLLIFITSSAYGADQSAKLTIDVKNVSVKEFLRTIEKQSGVGIVYISSDIENAGTVTYKCSNKEVGQVLRESLAPKGLAYRMENGKITIYKSVVKQQPTETAADQTKKNVRIAGIVLMDKQPVVGATLVIDGTSKGAITDEKGRFSFIGSAGDKVIISYLSAEEQSIVVKDSKEIVINMVATNMKVNDVVITGFGSISKRKNTGGTQSLKADDVLVPGMTSIQQALEGRVPELQFMLNSGEVGATGRLRLRGTSTLLGNREPLWVLDGVVLRDPVPVNPDDLNNPDYLNIVGNAIAGINPTDIERIDILKDASATALYGARAANGVIVVTTKVGAIGKPRITYNHTSKLTRRPRYTDKSINLMNSQERVDIGRSLVDSHYAFPSNMTMVGYEGAIHEYQKGMLTYDQFLDKVSIAENTNTDWFDVLTRDAYSMGHSLTVSGGSETSRYYASLGYDNDNGATRTTYSDRYSLRLNLDANIVKNLTLYVRANGNIQKKNNLLKELNAMDYAYNTTRTLPYKNADGTLHYIDHHGYSVGARNDGMYQYNISNEINNTSNSYNGNGLGVNLELRYKFNEWLDASLLSSYNNAATLQEQWIGEKTNYIALMRDSEYGELPVEGTQSYSEVPYGGILKQTHSKNENYSTRFQLNFAKLFGANMQHSITASGGLDISSNTDNNWNYEERGYYRDRGMQYVHNLNMDLYPKYKEWVNANKNKTIGSNLTNMVSGYIVAAYSFKEHFTLNANARFDTSNKFGDRSNERLLPVWSVSGVWNIDRTLLKNIPEINSIQLRGSFGKQGNMLDTESPNLIIKQGTMDAFYGENISTTSRMPNPNLRWEQTNSFNSELNTSLFDNRLQVGFTYYSKKTRDVFTDVKVSTVNGVSKMVMNGGDILNQGFSISLLVSPIKTKDIMWTLSTYYSVNKNTVDGDVINNYEYGNYLNGSAIVKGEAIGTFYSYRYMGLNGLNGIPVFDDYQDRMHLLAGLPLEEVVKMTMDKSGQRDPFMSGNLMSNFSYKGFSLNLNLAYSLGSKIRLFKLYSPVLGGVSAIDNLRKEFVNRWQKPGDELTTDVPVILSPSDPDHSNYQAHYSVKNIHKVPQFASSVWDMYDNAGARVVSGNYLKCQSITLRYNFAAALLEKTPIKGASISLSAMNLFTIASSKLKGQDPSQSGFVVPDLSVRPNYTFSFSISF